MTTSPRVTIGLPLYNGERYLEATLDSLLAQTLPDFELIIADNASTDASHAISRRLAERDARIRVIRHPRNLGGPRNWNFLAQCGSAPYFKWASANDLCAPSLLTDCVQALDADPDAILAHGDTMLIDGNGEPIGHYDDPLDVDAADPAERYRKLLLSIGLNNAMAGVFRRPLLLQTQLEGIYPGGDIPLMAQAALLGRFVHVPRVHCYRRIAEDASTTHLSAIALQEFHTPGADRLQARITWVQSLDLLRRAVRTSLPIRTRARLLGFLLRRMYWERRRLLAELRPGHRRVGIDRQNAPGA